MTICKFFLNGYCRFGANCRFEHAEPYYSQGNRQYRDGGGRGDFRRNDNYHWQKGGGGGNASEAGIAHAIREEVINFENGKMWPLTCFAPIPQNGNLKGWDDYSPEELRYEMWKAIQSNSLDSYEKTIHMLYSTYQEKRKKLKMINRETMDEVREYLAASSETNTSLSTNATSVFQSSSSVFGNSGSGQNFSFASAFDKTPSQSQAAASDFSFSQAFNNQPGSIFGGQTSKPGSIFGGQSGQLSGIYGQNQAAPSAPIFGQSQAPQQTPVFGQSQAAPLFGQAVFGPSQQTPVFGQNQAPQQAPVFGQNQAIQPTPAFGQNLSSQPANQFGQNQGSIFGNSNSAPTQSVFDNSYANSNNTHSNSAFLSGNNFNQNNSFQQNTTGSVFDQNNFQPNFASSTLQSPVKTSNNEINQNSGFSTNTNAFPSMPSISSAPSCFVYSPVDSLTKEDLSAYEAQTFSFKNIPLSAPPENLCH